MARFLKKIDRKVGQPPGSIIFVGERKMEAPKLTRIEYEPEYYREQSAENFEAFPKEHASEAVVWLNLDGLHDEAMVGSIGAANDLLPLDMEDIVNTARRPKVQGQEQYVFLSFRMLSLNEENRVQSETLSMVVFEDRLLTFQEHSGDVFNAVRDRLRKPKGRIRSRGATYLAYALLDCVAEHYVRVVEALGERIEDMEEEVLEESSPELLEEILDYRREMAFVRKQVRPVREVVRRLAHPDEELFGDDVEPHLRDLLDLVEQAAEAVDIYREMIDSALAAYNMVMGNRLNDVMRFLTIFSTIFIPLTFLAGIYGMNFEHMPELHYQWGYPISLGSMALVAIAMLAYFKRKHWL